MLPSCPKNSSEGPGLALNLFTTYVYGPGANVHTLGKRPGGTMAAKCPSAFWLKVAHGVSPGVTLFGSATFLSLMRWDGSRSGVVRLRLVGGKDQVDDLSHGDRTIAADHQFFVIHAFEVALDRLAGERAHLDGFRFGSPRAAQHKKFKDDKGEQTKSWHVQFTEETKQVGCGRHR